MIERAIAASEPFACVAADSVYGVGSLETALRRAGKGYVFGVAKNHGVNSWGKAKPIIAETAKSVPQGLATSEWKRLPGGEGTKGPRLYDWAYVELADLEASDFDTRRLRLWTRGLLIRRTITVMVGAAEACCFVNRPTDWHPDPGCDTPINGPAGDDSCLASRVQINFR
jgi:SRSO17 transposase